MEKKVSTPVTVGIILSLVIIVWSIVVYLTGLYMQTWSQYVGLVILVGGILYGVLNHGKEKNHEVTFGNLFGFGFKVAAVATCLVILYSILSGYIFPEAKQKMIEIAKEKAGDMNAENIEAIKKIVAGTARSMGVDVTK
jgi:type III secretory pathway component EscS